MAPAQRQGCERDLGQRLADRADEPHAAGCTRPRRASRPTDSRRRDARRGAARARGGARGVHVGPAWATFEEAAKGSLQRAVSRTHRPFARSDARDASTRFPSVEVDFTIFDGKVVYSREGAGPRPRRGRRRRSVLVKAKPATDRTARKAAIVRAARRARARKCPGKILVSGIKFHGFHGLTRIEREIGVRYSVDVEMDLRPVRAGRERTRSRTRSITGSSPHGRRHVGKTNSYRLIETLASRIVDAVLSRTRATAVLVRVTKGNADPRRDRRSVSVELTTRSAEVTVIIRQTFASRRRTACPCTPASASTCTGTPTGSLLLSIFRWIR